MSSVFDATCAAYARPRHAYSAIAAFLGAAGVVVTSAATAAEEWDPRIQAEHLRGLYPTDVSNEAACAIGDLVLFGGCGNRTVCSSRYRDMDEQGYQLCPQPSLYRPGCVVYSCGVDEDPTFEIDLALATGCEVYAFDPSPLGRRWMGYLIATADPPLPQNLHFLPWGWGEQDTVVEVSPWGVDLRGACKNCLWPWDTKQWGSPSSRWQMLRLSTIARRLNHTKVDLVKMDCEGVEYSEGFVEELLALAPDQVVLEQHAIKPVFEGGGLREQRVHVEEWLTLTEKLHKANYRQVWKGRLYHDLGEYTWSRRSLTSLHDGSEVT
eukprot:gnl/TRDRNA2_/TRDRNA2_129727_c0_seq2.p1 gnl/TRDRNA2_/TRDRNA2_129727_c0~~gnl/TRDRNA2_/TRDRNA2_129727_c0_seq2.p1  ORF type:complete len:323 (-),score=38.98 gnl/TRDRNA2_/TRDRNA2_129727_c0_seq2:24-992(-)